MMNRIALIGMALAGAQVVFSGIAAAADSASPRHGAVARTGQAAHAPKGGIAPDKDRFLTLLEKNVAAGGPPKDGIPAVDRPQYTSAAEANRWLVPEDVVFGIEYQGLVAAYPQRILVWHEIVNETVAGERISITYCPLTGTAIGYRGVVGVGGRSTFGVSGKLVNSNLIMYDRATDSWWPQILGQAITGPARGTTLEELRVVWTTWDKWKKKHPHTQVLSQRTGYLRNYGRGGDPYGSYLGADKGYYASEQLLFRPIFEDAQLHPKTVVVGVRDHAGGAAAILKERLRHEKRVELKLGERMAVVTYDAALDSHSAAWKDTGAWLNAFDAMWFAWKGFYPDTQLLR